MHCPIPFTITFLTENSLHTEVGLLKTELVRLSFILLHVHPLPGNELVNKFPRRQILGKQFVARLRNNRESCVYYVARAKQQ
jgi:hypothetical protein